MPYGRIRIRPIQWQLRLQWSQSKEKSSKLIPLDLQSRLAILGVGHPRVANGQFMKGSPNRDHRCEVLPVHRQQYSGLGCPLAGLTASGLWSQDQSQLYINVLELQVIWLGLRAFSQRVENAKVALMSDNTSELPT